MAELSERLRRLADDHARSARAPGPAAAVRRGRRRRRHQAVAAAAVLAALAGIAVGVWDPPQDAAIEPAAPTTTACAGPSCLRRPAVVPRGFEPAEGTVVAQGERPGFRWRLVARRAALAGGQRELFVLFQHDDNSPNADLVTLEPVKLSYLAPGVRDGTLELAGIVTDRTALVRLQLRQAGAPAPPVEVRPLDTGGVFPHNRLFVAFLPDGSTLLRIELLDRQGQPICAQRVGGGPAPARAERCF
jgi:hypothetical protein